MLSYETARKTLQEISERLKKVVGPESEGPLLGVEKKLKEEIFNLVVLGQFKRGKSTFINALLGADILPTAVVPLTSAVTILRYGEEKRAVIRFLDGTSAETQLDRLPAYITERENPKNRKNVKEVEVFYPSDQLKDGLRIIDTPGVGSVYQHNTDAALAYLPYVDAAIFVVSADPPLSKNEHAFLKDVRLYAHKLFFLLNKIDQVSEKDFEESMAFTREVLEEDLGAGNVRVHPLSARMALEAKKSGDRENLVRSHLPDFEEQLQSFLAQEKGVVFLTGAVHALLRSATAEIVALRLEQKAAQLPFEQLHEKIAVFEHEIKELQKDRDRSAYLLDGNMKSIVAQLDEDIRLFHKERLPLLHEAIEKEYLRSLQQKTPDLRDNLERFASDKIREVVGTWRQEMAERVSKKLEEAHHEFASKTNETIERVHALASNVFDLKLEPFVSIDGLTEKSGFYFLLKDDPLSLEMIRLAFISVLPSFIARRIILKNTKARATEWLDRHCGRVRYDLISRAGATSAQFRRTLDEKVDLTLEGIRRSLQSALSLARKSRVEIDRNEAVLAEKLKILNDIQRDLEDLRRATNGIARPPPAAQA